MPATRKIRDRAFLRTSWNFDASALGEKSFRIASRFGHVKFARLPATRAAVAFRASRDELAFAYFSRTEVTVEFLTSSSSLINNAPYETARAPI
jgi:hypothetical protein